VTKAITVSDDDTQKAYSLLSQGLSTRKVAKRLGISKTKLLSTLTKTRELQDQYRASLIGKACLEVGEIVDIADDTEIPVDRARLMIHARQWQASKLLQHVFGDGIKDGSMSINLGTQTQPLTIQLVSNAPPQSTQPIDTQQDVIDVGDVGDETES
jgi:hypothetical protein